MRPLNLVGQRFGRLVVLERAEKRHGSYYWLCLCDCGSRRVLFSASLKDGKTSSCGCLRKELSKERATKHGYCGTKIYFVWQAMIKRCSNPNNKDFIWYGARGIKVCARWCDSFENFLCDMGEPPKGLSLDRINNDGDYEPLNCRWATSSEQHANRRKLIRTYVPTKEHCEAISRGNRGKKFSQAHRKALSIAARHRRVREKLLRDPSRVVGAIQ